MGQGALVQIPPLPLPYPGALHKSLSFSGCASAPNKIRKKKAICLLYKVKLNEIMDMQLPRAERVDSCSFFFPTYISFLELP